MKIIQVSANFACGQLLFNLRNSNLNYLVKETPYSAYITIRKRLVNEAFEAVEAVQTIVTDINVKHVDKENIRLKERNAYVERQYALLKIEFEELEINFNELKDSNNQLDDKAEELFEENSELKKQNVTFVNDIKKEKEISKIELSNHKTEESKLTKDETSLYAIVFILNLGLIFFSSRDICRRTPPPFQSFWNKCFFCFF